MRHFFVRFFAIVFLTALPVGCGSTPTPHAGEARERPDVRTAGPAGKPLIVSLTSCCADTRRGMRSGGRSVPANVKEL